MPCRWAGELYICRKEEGEGEGGPCLGDAGGKPHQTHSQTHTHSPALPRWPRNRTGRRRLDGRWKQGRGPTSETPLRHSTAPSPQLPLHTEGPARAPRWGGEVGPRAAAEPRPPTRNAGLTPDRVSRPQAPRERPQPPPRPSPTGPPRASSPPPAARLGLDSPCTGASGRGPQLEPPGPRAPRPRGGPSGRAPGAEQRGAEPPPSPGGAPGHQRGGGEPGGGTKERRREEEVMEDRRGE